MKTLKQIAADLGKPESTVRYWRDLFNDFIPCEGRGRTRRYPEEAAEVLRLVCVMMERNANARDVKDALSRKFTVVLDVEPETQRNNATTQRKAMVPATAPGVDLPTVQGMIGEALSRTLGIIADQKSRLDILEERNRDLEKKVEALGRRRPSEDQDAADVGRLLKEALSLCRRFDAALDRIGILIEAKKSRITYRTE
jgi:DNA-binding transcriptional MerR regulator